ncbi:MAG: hypothetical protein RLZZ214_1435 [Verrucomicrobiota bacterium]|jgi:alpha-L-rhamnosidase
MKALYLVCTLALAAALTASAQPTLASSAAPAVFNTKRFNISDYGAVADGKTLNTAAIQRAIDTAATKGGGLIVVPKGTFMSGSIFMKRGVELWLDEGAVLLGSPNIADYPTMKTRIEGHFPQWTPALVNFPQMDHVRVGGKGQLNGNGPIYYAAFHNAPGAKNLDVPRPRLMFVDHCTDVRIEGISFQDSGFWNLHLYNCREVVIEGLRINAPAGSPSTDGIDVDSCQNVVIRKTQISNNDDNIALKGSKGPLANKEEASPPVENILIEDCEVGNGNGLVTCGSEATIIRNVTVRNCIITGSAWLITLKLRPDTAQHYSNITIDGIKLTGHANLINVAPWWHYFDLKGQSAPTRVLDNIVIRNVTGAASFFGGIRGNLPNAERGTLGDTIGNFTLENFDVKLTNPAPLSRGEIANLVYKNVVINGKLVEAPPATPAPAK